MRKRDLRKGWLLLAFVVGNDARSCLERAVSAEWELTSIHTGLWTVLSPEV